MPYQIRRAAVLGAGVMGAAIAAYLANIGLPSLLLDIVPPNEKKDRDVIARTGVEKALKARPAAFYSKSGVQLITVGNIEDDLEELANVDWIIEAVVERLDIKHDLYSKLERVLTSGTIISSNTSGLPAHQLIEGRSENFRHHFLIAHFFNPVRYMRLLELVPNADTNPALMQFMQTFATEVLGKGVVICKDTPNFIANRISVYRLLSTFQRALTEGYTVSEVDTILGPNMGRPKSAVFRTADLSGLDTLGHVADNLYKNIPYDEQRETFRIPEIMREMVSRGWLGEKSGQGFYKRIKSSEGASTILELNLKTLEYGPQQKVHYPSIDEARNIEDPLQRMFTILAGSDRASQLARETTVDGLIYAANCAEEIADNIVTIDEAMRWGFNLDMGSFELWDVFLRHPTIMQHVFQDHELPELVQRVISKGQGTFYIGTPGCQQYFDFHTNTYKFVPLPQGAFTLPALKIGNGPTGSRGIVRDNASATLIDLGDGVACVEFHTKKNAIDEGITEMLRYAVEEGPKQFRALIVGNEAVDFSAGANLNRLLRGARQGNWQLLENGVNELQQAHQMLKYCSIPIVAVPAGIALGGGCETIMHCNHACALAESYLGLVEVGVGLVPAGGGCKELLLRLGADVETQKAKKTGGTFMLVRKIFQTITLATVSTSAVEAQELGFLRKTDTITVNRDVLLRNAKADAIKLAEAQATDQWQPAQPQLLLLPGAGARMVLEQRIENLLLTGRVSEHDAIVVRHLAYVLTGGNCSPIIPLTEQQVLDLEREAFLSLCGMEKTQERMQAMLATGKPLRN